MQTVWGTHRCVDENFLKSCLDDPEFTSKLKAENGSLVVWLDFMKYGVVSKDELNHTVAMLSKALSSMPDKAIGFVIAPSSQSERRSGIREELRPGRGFSFILSKSFQFITYFNIMN